MDKGCNHSEWNRRLVAVSALHALEKALLFLRLATIEGTKNAALVTNNPKNGMIILMTHNTLPERR